MRGAYQLQGQGQDKDYHPKSGDWVVIEISDTGCGIPREIQSKIFDPFFTTRDVGQGKGQGQGLTVAYLAIVIKHAGEIALLHSSEEGTAFEIRLPIFPFCYLPHGALLNRWLTGFGATLKCCDRRRVQPRLLRDVVEKIN